MVLESQKKTVDFHFSNKFSANSIQQLVFSAKSISARLFSANGVSATIISVPQKSFNKENLDLFQDNVEIKI
jgi:hypothetical protein